MALTGQRMHRGAKAFRPSRPAPPGQYGSSSEAHDVDVAWWRPPRQGPRRRGTGRMPAIGGLAASTARATGATSSIRSTSRAHLGRAGPAPPTPPASAPPPSAASPSVRRTRPRRTADQTARSGSSGVRELRVADIDAVGASARSASTCCQCPAGRWFCQPCSSSTECRRCGRHCHDRSGEFSDHPEHLVAAGVPGRDAGRRSARSDRSGAARSVWPDRRPAAPPRRTAPIGDSGTVSSASPCTHTTRAPSPTWASGEAWWYRCGSDRASPSISAVTAPFPSRSIGGGHQVEQPGLGHRADDRDVRSRRDRPTRRCRPAATRGARARRRGDRRRNARRRRPDPAATGPRRAAGPARPANRRPGRRRPGWSASRRPRRPAVFDDGRRHPEPGQIPAERFGQFPAVGRPPVPAVDDDGHRQVRSRSAGTAWTVWLACGP